MDIYNKVWNKICDDLERGEHVDGHWVKDSFDLAGVDMVERSKNVCNWTRVFDGNFNISCVNDTGKRANGNFKRDEKWSETEWDFDFCPYCGNKISTQ